MLINQPILLCPTTTHRPLPSPRPGRPLKLEYNAAQPSAVDCCQLCQKTHKCTSWSYQPDGWLMDRSRRCM